MLQLECPRFICILLEAILSAGLDGRMDCKFNLHSEAYSRVYCLISPLFFLSANLQISFMPDISVPDSPIEVNGKIWSNNKSSLMQIAGDSLHSV